MNSFFQLSNLTYKFSNKLIFKDLNLSVSEGDFIGIIGPSGAGKTTLLRIICGLEKQTSGEIKLVNKILSNNQFSLPPQDRNIGLVIQEKVLFPHLTVRENINFGLLLKKGINRVEMIDLVKSFLVKFNIDDIENKYPHEISGGEAQRVALARSLVSLPKILLLDEPFNGLDNALKHEIYPELKKYLKDKKITTIMVSHNLEEIKELASKYYLIEKNGLKII